MSILQKLGAQSFSVIGHGPVGERCSKALVAALVCVMGATSTCAVAGEEPPRPDAVKDISEVVVEAEKKRLADGRDIARMNAEAEYSRLEKVKDIAERTIGVTGNFSPVTTAGAVLGHAAFLAASPEQALFRVGSELIVGASVGATTDSYSDGMAAAEVTASIIGASIAGPVIGSYMLYNQAQKSFAHYESKQEHIYDKSMDSSIARMDEIRSLEVIRLRMEERKGRATVPQEQQKMEQTATLERALSEFASGGMSETILARFDIEQRVEKAGGSTEAWYQEFNNHPLVAQHSHAEELQTNNPSLVGKFNEGLASMQTKYDEARHSANAASKNSFAPR